SWSLALPWGFDFYGTVYNSVWVCSNGFIDFTSSTTDFTNSLSELLNAVRISAIWYDLDTYVPCDIYVGQTADYVTIRWDAEVLGSGPPVDAEIVLYRNGDILFNYGDAHSGFTPTIGISAGDNTNYTVASINGSSSIPADTSLLFSYGGRLPGGLTLNETTGRISGAPTETGLFDLTFEVRDSGVPQQMASRDYALEILDTPPLTIDVPDIATEGDGLVSGTVSIPSPLPGDLVVSLRSHDASEVSFPAPSVVIPAGLTSAPLSMLVLDDAILDGSQMARVTASAPGHVDGSDQIIIHDNETATLTVEVPEAAAEGDGLLAGQGTVTISAVPADNIVVALSSDDTTEATVPATVTIPPGQRSATFNLTIQDDGDVDGTQTATITAHVENWTDGADAIDVHDPDSFITVLLPPEAWEGQGLLPGAGRVILGGTALVDIDVSLQSSDGTELLVPDSVKVPAGQTSATFDLLVQDDADHDGRQRVEVSATATGLTGDSAVMDIADDDLHHFAFGPIADPQTAGVGFAVTVTARDVNDETILVYAGAALSITGVGDGGGVTVEPTVTGAFAAGAWTGDVAVHAVDSGVVLTVEDGAGVTGSSNAFDVVPGAMDHFQWSVIPTPQYRDVPFGVTLSAVDANG
ncbi:MAG: Ig domain-containing protein, partial [Phycisphaerae bacterium]